MAKVFIKPTRSFFHDNQLFSVNKTVKVEEKDAELLVKNGWAVLTESKPKAAKTEDDKTDEDAISGSLNDDSSPEMPENPDNSDLLNENV